MIQGTQLGYIDVNKTVDTNLPLNFAGFLFSVNNWRWAHLPDNTNFSQVDGAGSNLTKLGLDFENDPENVIETIHSRRELNGSSPDLFTSATRERLYFIAATGRRYLMETVVRKQYDDLDLTSFDTVEYIPTVNTVGKWNLWTGDLQAYTPNDSGVLEVGKKVYIKNLSIQEKTPISIKNNTNTSLAPGGFGEVVEDNFITNYVNREVKLNNFECVGLTDGWYGIVTLESVPYYIEGGLGIDFDTFFLVENSIIQEFHPLYSSDYSNNLSEYGQSYTEFINN